jgi:type I restriction enzyme, S subunit
MEVKKGYKQTELGVIPEDWEVVSLFKIAGEIKSNFNDGDWIESEFITENDREIRFIQTGNIGIGNFIEKKPKKFISQSSFDKLKCKEIFENDLLICRLADPAGRSCILPNLFSPKTVTSVDVTIFRPIGGLAFKQYLNHFFCTKLWFELVSENSGGTTHKRISRFNLGKLKVVLPNFPEQQKIATVLSDTDELIASTERLLAKKREVKQATMQQLLSGKTRLPGFGGEWELKKLGDSITFQVGFPFSSTYFNINEGIRLIKNRDLKSNDSIVFYSGEYNSEFIINNGDLLVGMDGDFTPCLWKKGLSLLNQRVGKILAKNEKINLIYLYYYLIKKLKEIEEITSSTTVKHLSHDQVESINLNLPSINEQTAIAEVLTALDDELTALEQQLEKYRQLKQGLMQELLTGKTRLA